MVSLTIQRRLASQILKCSPSKVRFDEESLDEIKESITKVDVKGLIGRGIITKANTSEQSRVRARKTLAQKKKGLQKGKGSRKGTANARSNKRDEWINKIRKQREILKGLKSKSLITTTTHRMLANKAKGGYFRSARHLKTYMKENNLFVEK